MIDLHSHSTASDGACTPERLMELAADRGLAAIALTDHDTMDGAGRAKTAADSRGLLFIPGVEIEIEMDQGEFHLLGLGLSGDASGLIAALGGVQESRRQRNGLMVRKLQDAGMRHVENDGTEPPPRPLCLREMNRPSSDMSEWRDEAGSVGWPGQSNTESRSQSRPPGMQTKGSGEPGNPTFLSVFPEPANNLDGEC